MEPKAILTINREEGDASLIERFAVGEVYGLLVTRATEDRVDLDLVKLGTQEDLLANQASSQ